MWVNIRIIPRHTTVFRLSNNQKFRRSKNMNDLTLEEKVVYEKHKESIDALITKYGDESFTMLWSFGEGKEERVEESGTHLGGDRYAKSMYNKYPKLKLAK